MKLLSEERIIRRHMPNTIPSIRISADNPSPSTIRDRAKPKVRKSPGIAPDIFYDLDFCPIRSIFTSLGGKWSLLILSHLNFGTHRFSEILGAIPDISQRMLTQTLRALEGDGMVIREARATIPPRVDYTITPLGRNFLEQMEGVLQWSLINRDQIETNRHKYSKLKSLKRK